MTAVQAFPASYAQSRLWFLQQLEPGLTAYHMPRMWRLRGALDRGALERALGGLIERHPTLRTSFRLHGGEVLQLIHPPGGGVLATEELGERDSEAVIEEWLEEERRTPFDLTSGVLLRARLLQVSAEEHVLLVNHHHIASDGWSHSVLVRDLTELYNAHCTGRPPELPGLRVHYQDYAAWQRQRLSGDRLRELTEYWTGELEGLEPLELPGDRARPVMPSHRGGSVPFEIGAELLEPFAGLCRAEGATLQMGLLAVVALLLHRYSRQDDFAIGVPIWGRNHPDLEPLIGFFINTLPVRVRFGGEPSFRELLGQVREQSIGAYEHQELPFEQMVEALTVERDTSRNPLVQVMVQVMELPGAALQNFVGLEVESAPAGGAASRFDLEFFLRRRKDGGIQGHLVYAIDLFDQERIERLSTHLLMLIRSSLQSPDAAAAALSLLPAAERQLMAHWQEGPRIAVPDLPVHQLFEQQAKRTPEASALMFEDQQLSYAELNGRANQLAHHLRELGVGPEVVVGVCLERSVELIVALLAVLKAGGAYLPLDPNWPERHQQAIFRDANGRLLIDRDVCQSIPVDLAAADPRLANPELCIEAASLAYVLFTSGSTGAPKGVAVPHRTLTNLMAWHHQDPRLGMPARTLQFAASVFDVSFQEIFVTLTTGGELVLVRDADRRDPRALWGYVVDQRIERLFLPFVVLEQLAVAAVTSAAAGRDARIQDIVSAGETLSLTAPIRDFLAMLPKGRLHNHYGPTESHVVTTDLLGADPSQWPVEASIGKPIGNVSIRVLGLDGTPSPIGVPGEICIGGAGLARGYLNRPELTDQAFIDDPFSSDPGARLYRSGDLASWNPDGTLAFHGRIDQQIKLRGFRIEPGEIGATLLRHPGVSQAVVVLRQSDPANPRLIGYWVAKTGFQVSAQELRSFLSERLPQHMVPAAFVELAALPLTRNGKLDRRALPEPSLAVDPERRVEPTSALQRRLHGIWTEVLGHGEFGITDNFFAVGGHSLLSMRLDQLVRNELGLNVPIHMYFSHPTIQLLSEQLASSPQAVHAESASVADRDAPAISGALPAPIERLLAQQQAFLEQWPGRCAPGHRFVRLLGSAEASNRLFWCFQGANEHQALARQLAADVQVYGMRSLHQTDDARQIYGDPALLARVAGFYAAEILELTPADEPLILGGNCQAAWVANAVARELEAAGRRISRLIVMEPRLRELQNGLLRWSGGVALIWGRESRLNPFSPGFRPDSARLRWLQAWAPRIYRSRIEARLRRAFPGGYRLAVVPGVHGAFFRSDNIPGLAASIRDTVMEGTGCAHPAAAGPAEAG